MKIRSCLLKNMRGLPSIDLNFADPISEQIRTRTVFAGSNGSGKTTILETIGHTLGFINPRPVEWIHYQDATIRLIVDDLPPDSDKQLAIEVQASSPVRISFVSSPSETIDVKQQSKRMVHKVEMLGQVNKVHQQIQEAEQNSSSYPNCIYFPSEGRQLHAKKMGQVIAEKTPYKWIYRFTDSQKWPGSLESFLVAMYFRDLRSHYTETAHTNDNGNHPYSEGEFKRFIKIINRFLSNKQIYDVDNDFRVQVQRNDGQMQSIDHLSSGEKQIILLLGELQRRIQHGSVVMIDEPEIHLHPSWQRQLMRALTDLCQEYDAQLIITTQSEEIANSVYEHELILLDDIFEHGQYENPVASH